MRAVFVDCTDELAGVLDRLKLPIPLELTMHRGSPGAKALLDMCRDAEVMLVEHTVVPVDVLRACRGLRTIIFMGTGAGTYLPLTLCAELGIAVVTTPGYADRAVAEHAMALLFAGARNIARMDREIRAGDWIPRGGMQLHGRKIAVLGLGGIGRTFADMAVALGMRVAGWNRTLVAAPYYVADLRQTLDGADGLSIHLALTEQTRELIDAESLALLNPGAILVNTARAQVVHAAALQAALASGQIGHACLDVFSEEPLPGDHEWRDVGNVILTAHAAYMTDEAYAELWSKAMGALRAAQSGS